MIGGMKIFFHHEKFFDTEKYDFSYSNCHQYFEKSNKMEIYTKKVLPSGKIYDFYLRIT